MDSKIVPPKDVSPIYCSACRRFHGYESIKKGFVIIYCSNCKTWTVHIGRLSNVQRILKEIDPFIQHLTEDTKQRILKKEKQVSPEKPEMAQKGGEA